MQVNWCSGADGDCFFLSCHVQSSWLLAQHLRWPECRVAANNALAQTMGCQALPCILRVIRDAALAADFIEITEREIETNLLRRFWLWEGVAVVGVCLQNSHLRSILGWSLFSGRGNKAYGWASYECVYKEAVNRELWLQIGPYIFNIFYQLKKSAGQSAKKIVKI